MATDAVRRVVKSAWFFPALVLIGFGVITKGKIFMAFAPAGRFIIPLLLIYLGYRMVRARIKRRFEVFAQRFQEEVARQQYQQQAGHARGGSMRVPNGKQVIEICAACGSPKGPKCPKSCSK